MRYNVTSHQLAECNAHVNIFLWNMRNISRSLKGRPFLPPEPTILLASTKDRDLWPAPTPEVRDSRTHCQIWQLWLSGQKSRFLVLTKRIAASGDENKGKPVLTWQFVLTRHTVLCLISSLLLTC